MEWLNNLSPWWSIPLGLGAGTVLVGLLHIPSEIMWRRRMRREEARSMAMSELNMLDTMRLTQSVVTKKDEAKLLVDIQRKRKEITDKFARSK